MIWRPRRHDEQEISQLVAIVGPWWPRFKYAPWSDSIQNISNRICNYDGEHDPFPCSIELFFEMLVGDTFLNNLVNFDGILRSARGNSDCPDLKHPVRHLSTRVYYRHDLLP